MSTIVVGNIRRANGEAPALGEHVVDGVEIGPSKPDHVLLPCNLFIHNGSFLIEFLGDEHYRTEDIFEAALSFVSSFVLSKVVQQGVGLSLTIEYCKTQSNKIETFSPLVVRPDIRLEGADMFAMLGAVYGFRNSVEDYNRGLLHRENSPVFFYRCIETLARVVCEKRSDDSLEARDWQHFHNALETSKADMNTLLGFSKSHRHGDRDVIPDDDYVEMMKTARLFIARFVRWYKKSGYDPNEGYRERKKRQESST